MRKNIWISTLVVIILSLFTISGIGNCQTLKLGDNELYEKGELYNYF